MHLRYLILIFLFLPVLSFAQQARLQATIVDELSQEPVIGASVTLLTTTANAYIRGAQSGADGKVTLDQIIPGIYNLKISYLGLTDYVRTGVAFEAGKTLDIGVVKMTAAGQKLSEVVVQGKVPELQLGIDKKVFDVSQSMVSAGGTAQDLLGNVPTLQVDVDGNVNLRGSTARILIDGKESAMAGGDISRLLQSLPADVIAKVEIITNPSAKYDAEGQTGIVNIVLKKNVRTGFNGSATASVGNYDNYMAGVDLNYKDTKINYFGGYNFNHRKNVGESRSYSAIGLENGELTPTSRETNTDVDNSRLGKNHAFRFGADYYASDKTTLSLGSNISIRDNARNEDIRYAYRNIPEWGTSGTRESRQSEQDLGYDITFDFKQGLKRDGEELTANVTYGNDNEDGTNSFNQYFTGDRTQTSRRNVTGESGQNWNFQLDYVLPLGENHKFEAGYRSMLRSSDENQVSDTLLTSGQWERDYNVTNDFEMTSGVHALYVNYQRMLTDRIGAQVGLRAEDAYLNSTISSYEPGSPKTDYGKLDYFRWYPSVFLTYDLNKEGDKIQLNYSRRVQRPRGFQVNPFVNLSDETNLRQGNPNLMPEDIHAVEMSFAKFFSTWNFISSVYYRKVNDIIQPIQFDETDPVAALQLANRPNATFSRWQNVGSRDNIGLELISKVNFYKWWDATGNVNVFYNRINGSGTFNNVTVSNYSWSSNVTTNFKVLASLSAQIRGEYRSSMKTVQGNFKAMSGVDIAVKQDILKGKGSLVLNVRDVFDKRGFGSESMLPTRYVDNFMRWSKRTYGLTFSYRFGKQDFSKNKKDDNAPMEDAGAGGGEF